MKQLDFYNVTVFGLDDKIVINTTVDSFEEAIRYYTKYREKYKAFIVELYHWIGYLLNDKGEDDK